MSRRSFSEIEDQKLRRASEEGWSISKMEHTFSIGRDALLRRSIELGLKVNPARETVRLKPTATPMIEPLNSNYAEEAHRQNARSSHELLQRLIRAHRERAIVLDRV